MTNASQNGNSQERLPAERHFGSEMGHPRAQRNSCGSPLVRVEFLVSLDEIAQDEALDASHRLNGQGRRFPHTSVSLAGRDIGPGEDEQAAVGALTEGGGVEAEVLTPPPISGGAFFGHRGEPVLPEHGADLPGRSVGEGVGAEEGENVGGVIEETIFGGSDEHVLAPVGERGEPEVPVEAGLVGRVDAWILVEELWLVTKEVRRPGLAVVGALELDFVAATGHDGEQAVGVGYAEGLESGDRGLWERGVAPDDPDEFGGGGIGDPGEEDRGEGDAEGMEGREMFFLLC